MAAVAGEGGGKGGLSRQGESNSGAQGLHQDGSKFYLRFFSKKRVKRAKKILKINFFRRDVRRKEPCVNGGAGRAVRGRQRNTSDTC